MTAQTAQDVSGFKMKAAILKRRGKRREVSSRVGEFFVFITNIIKLTHRKCKFSFTVKYHAILKVA